MGDEKLKISKKQAKPNIYNYLDYRSYLKEYLNYQKQLDSNYSYRRFLKKAGIKSTGHLTEVLDKKRNLTNETTKKYLAALGFTAKESKYFETLVLMNQTGSDNIKKSCMKSMLNISQAARKQKITIIEHDLEYYFTKWHYIAIRELTLVNDFSEDPKYIRKKLDWQVSLKEIEEALIYLKEHKFVEYKDGKLKPCQGYLNSTDGLPKSSIRVYHKNAGKKALKAIENQKVNDRGFYGITFAVDDENLDEMRKDMDNFLKEMNAKYGGKKAKKIYQLNLQLFDYCKS